jgi:hypothetical protein
MLTFKKIMEKHEKVKADQHDHNNHLPKDILNLQQDPDSFQDPLEQQLEKQSAQVSVSNKDQKENNTRE